jgi:hypothetical protein
MLGLSRFFWFCLILFTVNQFIERAGIFIPIVHSYLDDLLCAGIVLGTALFVQQQLTFKHPEYTLPIKNLVFFVVWYSFLFEVLFPSMDKRHHADPWDILAYVIGTWLFATFGNKPVKELLLFKNLKGKKV